MSTRTTPADLAAEIDDLLVNLVARSLRSQRAVREWDQNDLADRCGVSRSVIAKIETKRRNTTLGELVMFTKVFGKDSVADFLVPVAMEVPGPQLQPLLVMLNLLSRKVETPGEDSFTRALRIAEAHANASVKAAE